MIGGGLGRDDDGEGGNGWYDSEINGLEVGMKND